MPPRAGAKLDVFLGERMLGALEPRGPARYRFSYSDDARAGDRSDPLGRLSASLPLREGAFTPGQSAPFFEGLLPEGAVRAAVAERLRISEADGFGLLAELGADCAGAVVVLPGGERPRTGPGQPVAVDDAELGQMLRDLPRDPLGIDVEPDGVRLSLGGVQDKLVLIRFPDGGFARPRGGALSTCLLKPEHERYEGLAVNEAFCMRVAAAAGADVAATELLTIGGIRCLYVERFDRVREADGRVVRLHQEDTCQALGILPAAKYEAAGGPTVADVVALLRRQSGRRAALDVTAFVRAVLANFLLGNSDAHGKNLSLLYDPVDGARLAPLYDIVSTAVYSELTPRMAMSIGGEEDPARVDLTSWERLAEDSGLGRQLSQLVRRWTGEVLDAVERCRNAALEDGWHDPVIEAIVEVCRERAAQLGGGR